MELLTIEGFEGTLKNIAATFQIDEDQIFRTLSSLEALGLIRRDMKGLFQLVKVNNSVLPTAYQTTEELKKLQIQLHLKSISVIESVSVEERDHTGIFMAIPSSRVPEAKKLIKSFRRKFMEILQKPGKRDSVYYLGNSFFPLCRVGKK